MFAEEGVWKALPRAYVYELSALEQTSLKKNDGLAKLVMLRVLSATWVLKLRLKWKKMARRMNT